MHSALVSHQSPVLDVLVNGNFKESGDKCVKWESVDEDTFIRFWQFVYTGKYTAANPVVGPERKSDTALEPPDSPPVVSGSPFGGFGGFGKEPKAEPPPKPPTKREAQWNEFKCSRSSTGLFSNFFGSSRENLAREDYTNVFLSHARLYVFAECYGIAKLMEASLDQLHGILTRFRLYKGRMKDIVMLVDYCYSNMVPEPLRKLVIRYTACKVDKLWLSEEFQELVEAHGELSRALIGSILNRLD
ncbi:hypothetical protein PT974_07608 [Cladobotryum mycophilum]|uniref:BTB domain-containing protein n=1 Tax=Cladobotryum mycophilum TaxID=491253 RepID=A0ABR0SPR7_9HYPO